MGILQFSYNATFNPFLYLNPEASNVMRSAFTAQHVEIPMQVPVERRKTHWAMRMPLGVFAGLYAEPWTLDNLEAHRTARDEVLAIALRTQRAAAGGARTRRPWSSRSDILEIDSWPYYTLATLTVFAEHAPRREFFIAAAAFIKAANADFNLIRKLKRNVTPFTPLEQRVAKFGSMVRGPSWSPEEDAVLRRWFGRRTYGDHAGKHATLTDEEWGYVLEQLEHRRSRQAVRDRISALNKQLHASMEVDGYVARARLDEYMGKVLGEKPRRPRMISARPRKRRTVENTASSP